MAPNTLSTNILTCDECGASFPDEDELYDEHFWFNHRSNVYTYTYTILDIKYHIQPSDYPHPLNQWYVSCDPQQFWDPSLAERQASL